MGGGGTFKYIAIRSLELQVQAIKIVDFWDFPVDLLNNEIIDYTQYWRRC